MSRTLNAMVLSLGILAISVGTALAHCGHSTQSVSIETQTASTGEQVPSGSKPETGSK